MSYSFKRGESVRDGVIRIARDQMSRATKEIEQGGVLPHEAVHQVRKRCKKLRGLLRLVRPVLGKKTYGRENARFRDAAQSLSYIRDAQSSIECLDDLLRHYRRHIDPALGQDLRTRLVARRHDLAHNLVGVESRLEQVHETLQEAYQQAASWTLKKEGFAAVAGGFETTYRRGGKAMAAAYADPGAETFHEWRKRAKYHWYHQLLLRPLWKGVIKKQAGALDDLGDLLGDEHDLAVLKARLLQKPEDLGAVADLELLLALIDRRRLELQAQARTLGERIYAEEPGALLRRYQRYWEAWQAEGGEAAAYLPELVEPTRVSG